MHDKLRLAAVAASIALTGCAGNMKVQPMTADPEGYSANAFSYAALPVATQALLKPPGSEPYPFKRAVIKGWSFDKRKPEDKLAFETLFINDRDDGMLRQIGKSEANGLLVNRFFAAVYHGAVALGSQSASPSRTWTAPPRYSRAANAWSSLADIKENSEYRFELRESTKDPLDTGRPWTRACKTGAAYPASKLLPALAGRAIEMTCVDANENAVTQREVVYGWLVDYKLALSVSSKTPNGVYATEYESAQFQ
ncbi:hypothetical protein [Bordetella pseudohinzii]|nr:hypothetical protein [Bordetella pseudohinzii]CUI71016.1 Uncharacterised protein [Bordetella pseudohinzii]